jgi:uncharacterized protein (TIGR02757 family)
MPNRNNLSEKELKDFLDEKQELYNRLSFIELDPVSIPHKFTRKEDIEIAGFFSASIAWGQRTTILRNANWLMELMDNEPYQFIINSKKKDWKRFKGFTHRTFQEKDVIYFIQSLQNIYRNHGGLEKVFSEKSKNEIKNGIQHFRNIFLEINTAGRTAKHIANVERNSSAKRINMYLRWMVRKDKKGVDFGLWKNISPSLLYCPLDLHSGRVARKLGLLTRKQDDWKAVCELTMNLRLLDPKDPIKYDFALFGLGVFERF